MFLGIFLQFKGDPALPHENGSPQMVCAQLTIRIRRIALKRRPACPIASAGPRERWTNRKATNGSIPYGDERPFPILPLYSSARLHSFTRPRPRGRCGPGYSGLGCQYKSGHRRLQSILWERERKLSDGGRCGQTNILHDNEPLRGNLLLFRRHRIQHLGPGKRILE